MDASGTAPNEVVIMLKTFYWVIISENVAACEGALRSKVAIQVDEC